jgi:hypothetical protein
VSVNIVPHTSHRLGIVAFIKLGHSIAGVYMFVFVFNDRKACALISSCNDLSWETVITAGFELDVFRGKRPYRWTIWVSALYFAKPRCPQHKPVALPWNPLHRIACFGLLLHAYRRRKRSLSRKACMALVSITITEAALNIHFSHSQ